MIPQRTRATAERELYGKNAAGAWAVGTGGADPYVKFNIGVGFGYFELSIDGCRLSDHLLDSGYTHYDLFEITLRPSCSRAV
jgi:hypothetical protein